MIDILSWIGVLVAFGSYVGGSMGYFSFEDWKYHAVQLVNSVLLTTVFVIVGMPAYIAFNAAWGTVGAIKLYRIYANRRKRERSKQRISAYQTAQGSAT